MLDIFIGLCVVGFIVFMAYKIRVNLVYQWNWELIPQFLFRYDAEQQAWVPNLLILGFINTIRLSVWAIVFAVIAGLMIGLCRISQRLFFRLIGATYIKLIRNLPPLVLIFIFYYFVGDQLLRLIGIESFIRSRSPETQAVLAILIAPVPLFSAFLSAVITLALLEGAYIAEIFRAGVNSVETGQWEAASALGLTDFQRMRHVILPQAIRKMTPPLAGQFIATIKDSAIVSVISIQELTFQGMEIMAATYHTFEIWITITLMYYILTQSLSLLAGLLERKMNRGRNFIH